MHKWLIFLCVSSSVNSSAFLSSSDSSPFQSAFVSAIIAAVFPRYSLYCISRRFLLSYLIQTLHPSIHQTTFLLSGEFYFIETKAVIDPRTHLDSPPPIRAATIFTRSQLERHSIAHDGFIC